MKTKYYLIDDQGRIKRFDDKGRYDLYVSRFECIPFGKNFPTKDEYYRKIENKFGMILNR